MSNKVNQKKQSSNKLQTEVLDANIGKDVKIVLFTGQEMAAIILDYDQYSILVRTIAKKTAMIYKHAIMYIEEAAS